IDVTEAIVVVGGRDSNNTRQLVETCRAAGRRAFHIERPDELRSEWFDGISVVGLTAGTSTARETVDAAFRRLEEIARTLPWLGDSRFSCDAMLIVWLSLCRERVLNWLCNFLLS